MWSYPLTSSSTEVKNEWSYISIPPHAFTGCTGTPLPWNTMEQEINYPQRRQYYYDETESIFIRTMDQVVSQWGTDVTTILPPPPLHSGIESIQKGNVMFYHFFFSFQFVVLVCTTLFSVTVVLWVLAMTYVLSLFSGFMNVYWACLRQWTVSNIIRVFLQCKRMLGFKYWERSNGLSIWLQCVKD